MANRSDRFTNILYDKAEGTFSGEENGDKFIANPLLFLINEAWHKGLDLEDLADGYGEGEGTHGDWSGIRDSSDDAKNDMFAAALNFLFKR